MPIYEYRCEKCRHVFEKLVFSGDNEPVACPECGGKQVNKLISYASFIGSTAAGGCSSSNSSGFS
jgi:putative FmdB family regulatory protein